MPPLRTSEYPPSSCKNGLDSPTRSIIAQVVGCAGYKTATGGYIWETRKAPCPRGGEQGAISEAPDGLLARLLEDLRGREGQQARQANLHSLIAERAVRAEQLLQHVGILLLRVADHLA